MKFLRCFSKACACAQLKGSSITVKYLLIDCDVDIATYALFRLSKHVYANTI